MSASCVVAQISDLHIGAGPFGSGETSSTHLRRAMKALERFHPDAILATGDLANDERAEEYAELANILSDAPAPVYLLPGNHDSPARLKAAFPAHAYLPTEAPLSYAIDSYPVRLVCVDQTAPGMVGGAFTPAHAKWLDATLSKAPQAPTIVALHHPPFKTYDVLFDTIALSGDDLFADVIAKHRQVGRVVCGHHHRMALGSAAHAPAISAPSTAWTYGLAFRPEDQIAPKTLEPPGFLLHFWTESHGFATHLVSF